MIRPEARATLWRWREALAGLGMAALGLWWIAGPGQLLGWVGWIVLAAGLALAVAGIQRGRFRGAGDGPGVVQVDEGAIHYFGPLTGGQAALTEISRLVIDRGARPAHWRIEQRGHPPLTIPVTARGADALFEVFVQLPGLTAQRLIAARRGPPQEQEVWRRDDAAPAPRLRTEPVRRLH